MKRARLAATGAALAIAVVAQMWLGVSAVTVRQQDLAVDSLELVGPRPGWTEGVPTDTRIKVTVHNRGTAAAHYQVDYMWVQDGMRTPLNGDATNSFNVSSAALAPGEQRSHIEAWRLQPNQLGQGAVEARVHLATGAGAGSIEDDDPDNDAARTDVRVFVHSLALDAEGPDVEVAPDGTGFFRIRATNGGNEPLAAWLSVTAPPGDQRLHASIDPPSLAVPQGQNRTATVYVDFRPAGDFASFVGNMTIAADPGFGAPKSAVSPTIRTVVGGGTTGYALHLAAASMGGGIAPGAQQTHALTMTNTGQRPDNYTLRASTPSGWQATLVPARVALYPGEEHPLQLVLRAPDSLPEGTLATVRVEAIGMTGQNEHLDVTLRSTGPAPIIEGLAVDGTPYVGDRPTLFVDIANDGDAAVRDGTLLALRVAAPGALERVHEVPLPAIPAGATLRAAHQLDPLLAGGPLHVHASLQTATQAEASLSALVHAPDVGIQRADPLAGTPGETLAYRNPPHAFRVTNTGNAAETLRFSASAGLGDAAIEGATEALLEPGATRTVRVIQTLPRPASVDEVPLEFAARLAARDRAWITSTPSSIVDRQPPVIHPPGLPDVWGIGSPFALEVKIEDDTAVVHANATIAAGDALHTVVLAHGDGKWQASLVFATPGTRDITVRATDRGGNSATAPSGTMSVQHVEPPHLRITGVPSNGTVNRSTQLFVEVEDERPLGALTLAARHGNATTRSALDAAARPAQVPLSMLHPGAWQLTVTAINTAGASAATTVHVQMESEAVPEGAHATGKQAAGLGPWMPLLGGLALAAGRQPPRRNPERS